MGIKRFLIDTSNGTTNATYEAHKPPLYTCFSGFLHIAHSNFLSENCWENGKERRDSADRANH